jgi:hypothetical protein
VDKADRKDRAVGFLVDSASNFCPRLACRTMSVLDDFVRIRLYRTRASEFELVAETEPLSGATSLSHYRAPL